MQQEFVPDSWMRAGSEYAAVSGEFVTSASAVLSETTSGGGGGHPVDDALSGVLEEIAGLGTSVISELAVALDGDADRLDQTGLAYLAIEAENRGQAGRMV